MSLKLFGIGSAAVLAAAAALLAVQTVGYANGGFAPAQDQPTEAANLPATPIQIDLPAGWSKVPALQNEGALYALRCEAKGCIPGVTATLSCVSAVGPHDGAARELVRLAGERPAVRANRETLTSTASVLTVHGREFHERSSVLNNGRYVVTAAARLGDDVCGIGLTGPRSEGARLDLTMRSMLLRLQFS